MTSLSLSPRKFTIMASKTTQVYAIFGLFAVGCVSAHRKFPLGVHDFADIIVNNFTYADKSMFIKAVMRDDPSLILITRPRLFGKTTALSMLRYFLENRISPATAKKIGRLDLFRGTSISKDTAFCRVHRGQYPTIHLSLSNVNADSYEAAKTDIAHSVGEEKRTFEAVRDETASLSDITAGVRMLCSYLHRKNNRTVVLLIDSFEKPTLTAFLNHYTDQMRSVLNDLLLPVLKDNPHVCKCVITSISGIGQESLLAKLPEMRVYSVLDDERYTEFFGFLESDVRTLVDEAGLTAKRELLDTWYRGYEFCGTQLYNPFSVLSFLNQGGKPGVYWVPGGLTDFVVELMFALAPTVVRPALEKLFSNGSIDTVMYRDMSYLIVFPDPLWTLLVHNGYLIATPRDISGLHTVRIPTKEIRDGLLDLCTKKMPGKLNVTNPIPLYKENKTSTINSTST
ncbi:unnamed protein product [Bemisia tabaci]|uniref:AAA-ATPase-like domain-containing protein n=1 Tax=Bemisia tabaci TaxID=7038 RepID=A0A9P0F912_BEMTA|nr:unnamed protein product [Bemisia tabaci]